MKSMTFTVPPILGCLRAVEEYLGWPLFQWKPCNDQQRAFLDKFADGIAETGKIADVLKSIADRDVTVINAWLKERGFDIQLRPGSPETFSVASVLDVLVEWLEEGTVTRIEPELGKASYTAVLIKRGVDFFTSDRYTMASIKTKKGEIVHMAMPAKQPPLSSFTASGMAAMLDDVSFGLEHDNSYEGVIFPMVDYDQHVDISWIEGLSTGTGSSDYRIEEAVQQTKFRMDEFGARVQSAAAMTMRCMAALGGKPPMIFDKPFLLWIERPGCKMPLFVGWMAEDCWRRPRCTRTV